MSKGDSNQQLGAPALPQVNLLPPEVWAARNLGRVKAWLGAALVMTLLLAAAGFGYAVQQERGAASDLATVHKDGANLLIQQGKYAEVPKFLAALSDAKAARTIALSTEVLWQGYFAAIAATMPAGVSLTKIEVKGGTPLVASPPSTNPLLGRSVYTIKFTAQSLRLPDAAAFADALNSIPGFADATVDSAKINSGKTVAYYETLATVQVRDTALANRFVGKIGAS